jgi:hypothetical protein
VHLDKTNIQDSKNDSTVPEEVAESVQLMMPQHSKEDLRTSMTLLEIEDSIETAIRILMDPTAGSSGSIPKLDHSISLAALGLDSLTLVQVKAVLENRLVTKYEFFVS